MVSNTLSDAVIRYIENGYCVFPCKAGSKKPDCQNGVKDATGDPDIGRRLFSNPQNIGLACDGFMVIDCDVGNSWEGVGQLEQEDCPKATTPSGGRHFLFCKPAGKNWRPSAGKLAPKIDTRTDGSYIVVAPSATDAGDYRWDSELPPREDLPEPPAWLAEQLDAVFTKPAEKVGQSPAPPAVELTDKIARASAYLDAMPGAISGSGGHNATFTAVQAMVHGFLLEPETALTLMLERFNPRCEPPWTEQELKHKIQSAADHPPDKPAGWLLTEGHDKVSTDNDVDISALLEGITVDKEKGNFGDFKVWDCEDLMRADLRQNFLIENVLVEKQPCIVGGPKKCLKTSILIDMAVALATGNLFLGHFIVPTAQQVLIMTGESGLVTIRDTVKRVAATIDVDPESLQTLKICDKVPKLDNPEHLATLAAIIKEYKPDVIIFDPAYLMLAGDKQENVFVTGKQLQAIAQLCLSYGATPVLVHHNAKGANRIGQKPDLDHLSFSGFAEFARQWVLLERKRRFDPLTGEHHLTALIGGSFGHGGEYDITIREGRFPDRVWDVELLDIDGIAGQGESETVMRHRQKVLDALRENPGGLSKSHIRTIAGLNMPNIQTAIDSLVAMDMVVECELENPTNGTTHTGYQLAIST